LIFLFIIRFNLILTYICLLNEKLTILITTKKNEKYANIIVEKIHVKNAEEVIFVNINV
jgi:hypothetical protein